jgi:hypothetical protein
MQDIVSISCIWFACSSLLNFAVLEFKTKRKADHPVLVIITIFFVSA